MQQLQFKASTCQHHQYYQLEMFCQQAILNQEQVVINQKKETLLQL